MIKLMRPKKVAAIAVAVLSILTAATLHAQQGTVTGRVTEEGT